MAAMERLCCSLSTYLLVFLFCSFVPATARVHTLDLKYDIRTNFMLSSFGFFKDGRLEVHLKNFRFTPQNTSKVFGFSLDKTINDAISAYLENHQDRCVLRDADFSSMTVILFTMDLKNKKLKINCSKNMQSIRIERLQPHGENEAIRKQRAISDKFSDSYLMHRKKRSNSEAAPKVTVLGENSTVSVTEMSTKITETSASDASSEKKQVTANETSKATNTEQKEDEQESVTTCGKGLVFDIIERKQATYSEYETGFVVQITKVEEEGLYNLYFHNCPNYYERGMDGMPTAVNLTIQIEEKNGDNYLSAGEMPLPSVYFFMSILFFLSGCIWIFVLRKSNSADVFKIHHLMAVLIYLKSFSLLFHGINFHFIQSSGMQIEGWAVLYYITHLLKGALLFITIVLIGTGWAWIKHIISDKEKKIFMIVIPLQVLANVAEIIIEESEQGDSAHLAWRDVFFLVDLLCCGAILFPVVWSIRHLQEASQTDGKAAINLKKLKLFRHFYIMIVCYIYFTRIIVYLLRITVPFKYEWLDETFRAVATLTFFVMTGYKFRPASNNPYLQLPQEDHEIEMEEVLTQCGAMDSVSKVGRIRISEKDNSITKKESSLEYD